MLDINLFRTEKGGDPEIVKESQRRRYAPVELVDKVIELDVQWREGTFLSTALYIAHTRARMCPFRELRIRSSDVCHYYN